VAHTYNVEIDLWVEVGSGKVSETPSENKQTKNPPQKNTN
jgi:hypothetical protein